MSNIPIFIVSLKDSIRRASIDKQLNGYDYQFVDAVDGKTLVDDFINKINASEWVRRRYKRSLSAGEIGCSLSHMSIYHMMKVNNIEWAIILEDDVILETDIYPLVNSDVNFLNKNSLYVLGAQDYLDSEKLIITSRFSDFSINEKIVFKKTIASSKYIYRTAAYLINQSVAGSIYQFSNNDFCLADDWDVFYKKKFFDSIYLSNIISHPKPTTTQSLLEATRSNEKIKRNFIIVLLKSIRNKFRCTVNKFL
ncbi:glycosyltransferase family 25 protein [Candidatus Symbiopectobacterium sp. NZEC127]|uniref:glycosyltransferase family 25 protein n=1 Tax=Candidatus Symbiopectobacterium sp. NZEC127 TaxID=2820472 RepID=UPI002226E175|nr:glycosyltransferase family 25 protein [Candidatus Symbiopectobacterium sp. NZEC127]MCW2488637.1 glycosyltransferase family 25 protein [Candidatus Symbiopectobacterium sp. NZEC127]